ncbi:dihydropteroate synthase [Geoalkalibacter subterraneus]|nr:dihydropteroate synthase [Geoalkalibacter subterraneus]
MTSSPPRLLQIASEPQALAELRRLGAGPWESYLPHLLAGGDLIKVHDVSQALFRCLQASVGTSLKQIVPSASLLGGNAAGGDLLLCGDRPGLRALCQALQKNGGVPEARLAQSLSLLLDRSERPATSLRGRTCTLDLSRPRIMGILNITPDSFSDGGCYLDPDCALKQARNMVEQGVDLIDIGGESTRPGSTGVDEEEEVRRVVPIVERIAAQCAVPISVDTTKSRVAHEAILAGAEFINDVSGLRFDSEMARVAAQTGAGLFLMHTRGRSDIMQKRTDYADLLGDVCRYLAEGIELAYAAGVEEDRIAVDPGVGFGKDAAGNLEILRRLAELHCLGRPILLGTSRKAFLGKILDRPQPCERLFGTVATTALGVAQGARIFRVHDVAPNRDAALTAWAIHPYV